MQIDTALRFTVWQNLSNYDFLIWTLGALYVAEIAQPNIRGFLGNCLSFSVALGITMAMFLGAVFPWRIVSIVCCVPQVIGMFHYMLFSDKSPIRIHDAIWSFIVDLYFFFLLFNLSSQNSGYSKVKNLILSNIDTFIGLLISQSEPIFSRWAHDHANSKSYFSCLVQIPVLYTVGL